MTIESRPSDDDLSKEIRHTDSTKDQTGTRDYSRRDALRAMGAYSAFVGATGLVVLSAEDAVAQAGQPSCFRDCRQAFPPGRRRRRCFRRCREQQQLNDNFID